MFQYGFRIGMVVLVLLVPIASLQGQSRDSLIQSVRSLPDWTASGPPAVFNDPTTEKLGPDLASIRDTYGLSGVTVQDWHGSKGKVRSAMFQFTDSGSAYSFFTIRRKFEGTPSSDFSAGTEAFQSGKYRYFWQSKYVVRLDGEGPAIDMLAGILSERILGGSQRPSLSNHLPSKNVVAGSEIYILDSANFQRVEGRAAGMNASSLGFDLSAEAAAADYRVDGKTGRLLLMLYPTQQIAKKISDQINSTSPESASSLKRIGPLLAIVSGISDASAKQTLLEQVHYQSSVTWSEPQPGLGLGPIVVTAFTFIGILLGVCIIAGVGLGGTRLIRKSLYPNRIFDRDKDGEIIQLKLDQ
jgi:hypothetical protein